MEKPVTKKWSKAKAERVGLFVRHAISELEDATKPSCPNELAMRSTMALIQLSNAFMEAGLNPLEMLIPCEEGTLRQLTWMSPPGRRQKVMLGADRVDEQGNKIGDLFTDRMGNPIHDQPTPEAEPAAK
jgi:hypothetical protein